jgi:hypothetical protein
VREEYKPIATAISIETPLSSSTNDFWLELDAEERAEQALADEYKQYYQAPVVFVDNAIKWWLEPTQQKLFPNLSKMALDFLSIPGMSAELERLFSHAKITITDR